MNFIERKDNLLTKKECADAIEWVLKHKIMIPDSNKETTSGYDYCNLMDEGEDRHQCFSSIPLRPIYRAINTLKDFYIKSFPEVQWIHPWTLQYVRFKWWKPGYSFSNWHSEHDSINTKRVMSFLISLSDNDSFTEFKRYRNVPTRAGRGIMFPSYFTHTHRGSPCKKGLDRYMISGYYYFV